MVNGVPWAGDARAIMHAMPARSLQEWTLSAEESPGLRHLHPYHHHGTHFQIVAVGGDLTPEARALVGDVGDFRDSLMLAFDLNFTIRFVPPWVGRWVGGG